MNYLKIHRFSIFKNTYCYIDSRNNHIDNIFDEVGWIPGLKFLDMAYVKDDFPLQFAFLKCPKYASWFLEEEVFPKLHVALWNIFGGQYTDLCKRMNP